MAVEEPLIALRPASQCSSHEIEAAARWLQQQWPRGGSVDDYTLKLVGNDNNKAAAATSNLSLPCSFLLVKGDVVIAHGRLTECFEGAGGSAAAATYIIAEPRGLGYGSRLMKLLEKQAIDMGYHYVYLWTASAVPFYQKIGYNQCERISLYSACLKKLECDQVSNLEAMLSKKVGGHNNKFSETVMLPPDEAAGENNDVWLRKRLVECVSSQIVPLEQRFDEIRDTVALSEHCSWEYYLIEIPWQQQVGPSCGLSALSMLRDHYLDDDNKNITRQMPSLLQEAVKNRYSVDGEIFDAANLVKLANFCGLDTVLCDFPSPQDILSVLRTGGTIIVPYDSQSSTKRPCKNQGRKAHYGIVVGILFGFSGEDDNTVLKEYTHRCIDEAMSDDIMLLVQQSLSPKLTIATWTEFFNSNQQLNTIDKTKYNSTSVLNLKNRAIVCRGRVSP